MVRLHFTINNNNMARWLDTLDRSGWQFRCGGAGVCIFDAGRPGQYNYQVDFTGFKGTDASYLDQVHACGAEVVSTWGPWTILRRSAADGPFELHAGDEHAKLDQLWRMLRFFKILACLVLLGDLRILWDGFANGTWWLVVIGGAFLAFVACLIHRASQLRREMAALGWTPCTPPTCRAARILVGAGCLAASIGLLLQESAGVSTSEFLKGSGCGLMLVGLVRMTWMGNRPA